MAVTKRFFVMIAAIILPLALILSGCAKRLTAKEYSDELYAAFKEYAAALDEIESVQANVTSSQDVMIEQSKATEVCQNAETALEKFKKLKPPKQFAEKHKALLEAVELEKRFVAASEKVLTARTPEELDQYGSEASMIFAGVPEEQQLSAQLVTLITEARAAA